jgi:hypothetical protein
MEDEFDKQLEEIKKKAMIRNAETKMLKAEHEFLMLKMKYGLLQCETILNGSTQKEKDTEKEK